jgi:SPASM domain peptide maturase of grasp-with-spasm system
MTNYFNLFPNCVITRGPINSLIVDYKNEVLFNVPNFVQDIIEELCQSDFNEILFNYKEDSEIVRKIERLKEWLITNNLGVMAPKSNAFSPMANNFEFPTVSNAVIEIGDFDKIKSEIYIKALEQLSELECKAVQIIFVESSNLIEISKFLKVFNKLIFQSVEIVMRLKDEPSVESIENLIMQNLFLKKVYIFGCKHKNIVQLKKFDALAVFSTEDYYTPKQCGSICKDYFSTNLMTYFEGKKHNTCLNQKIAIDVKGNIKNCLSLKEIFGNVGHSSLSQALNSKDFKKYWNITKDNINICKNCEFRYVCTDCRAFLEDPNDILSKPLKCGYDPNTGQWNSWRENPLKQKVINYYGL